MTNLRGKTMFVTGGSRGIGLAIALRAARDGANVAIAAKTSDPHPKLAGTIHTSAAAITEAGGKGLAIQMDVREEASVAAGALAQTAETFGGIDIIVNNASAIQLTDSQATDMKRFDLMLGVNTRGTFLVSKLAVPYLLKSDNPHILALSPPLDMQAKWFKAHTAYSIAKYGMSMTVLGLSAELRKAGIAVNALWPRTTIATAAIEFVVGEALMQMSRTPEIMADAAHAIFVKPAKDFTGQFLIDDTFLASEGVTDFELYRVDATKPLAEDFFVPADIPPPPGVKTVRVGVTPAPRLTASCAS